MAGKHRKSRRRSSAARRGGSGLAAAAVSVTSLSTVVLTGTSAAVAPDVQLMALITPANSTSQFFAGTTYYGRDYTETYGSQQVVPFLLGPRGIADAIKQNSGEPTVVLSSGWGAGQTGTALGLLQPEDLANVDRVILDNNANRAGGGFWTTYYPFAPLLLTSATPTPNDLDVEIWDVGYEYNINGNAVTYPINVVSLANSLVAYVYGYGAEQHAQLPDVPGGPQPGKHYVVAPDGSFVVYDLDDSITTTYVTFKSDGLPLVRPLRLLPGGDIVADTLEPALTEIVNAGYQDNKPIPDDPSVPRPMGLWPTSETTTMLNRLPSAVQTGLQDGVATAQADVSSPSNFVTKPLDEAGKLPIVSSLGAPSPTTSATNRVETSGGNKVLPGSNRAGSTATAGNSGSLKQVADTISSSLRGLAGGAPKDGADAPSTSSDPKTP